MDGKVVQSCVIALAVEVIGAGIQSDMDQGAVSRKHDDVTGYQIGIGFLGIGVLCNTAPLLRCKGVQHILPQSYRGQIVAVTLLPCSTAVDANTLDRYYTKLIGLEPGFVDLKSNDLNACQNAAKAVSTWLRGKTRDAKFSLVHEENLNYGFIRNLFAVKSAFLVCFTAYNVLLIGFLIVSNWELSPVDYFSTIPVEHVACMIIHVTVYLVWLLGISKKILDFAAKKYAKSVIHAIDEITG